MLKNSDKIILGYNLFLEHVLEYDTQDEKGRLNKKPKVHLAGSSWNIAKSLESLGVRQDNMCFVGVVGSKKDALSEGINFLLSKEKIGTIILKLRDRSSSSYYLVSPNEDNFALGDVGGGIKINAGVKSQLLNQNNDAYIKVVTETSNNSGDLELTKLFLKKRTARQVSVFIPSLEIIKSKKILNLLKYCDLLSMNLIEATHFFGNLPDKGMLLKCKVPNILVTLGKDGALLKTNNNVYFEPAFPAKGTVFPAGAGDSATTGVIYGLFCKAMSPKDTLKLAMKMSAETLMSPLPYWISNT